MTVKAALRHMTSAQLSDAEVGLSDGSPLASLIFELNNLTDPHCQPWEGKNTHGRLLSSLISQAFAQMSTPYFGVKVVQLAQLACVW